MKLWLIVIQGDDTTWVEDAWDDDTTAENNAGWKEAVEKAREMAAASGNDLRVLEVDVDGIYEAFEPPKLKGEVEP